MDSYITPPYTPLFPANPTSNTAPLVPTSSSPLPHAHRVPPRFPYHIDDDAEIIFNITNPGNLPNGTAVTDSSGTLRVVRWGELPQTVEFHLDWTLEKVAYEVNSDIVTKIIRQMVVVRESSAVSAIPTFKSSTHEPHKLPPPYPTKAVLLPDCSYDSRTTWDHFLSEARSASKAMSKKRKWKLQGRRTVAGWCHWARVQIIDEKGEFIQDLENGIELVRKLSSQARPPAVTRAQRRSSAADAEGKTWGIKLGYRRSFGDGETCPLSPWDEGVHTALDRDVMAWYEQSVPDRSFQSMQRVEKLGRVREEFSRRS